MLFWPSFRELEEDHPSQKDADGNPTKVKYWEISLFWSEKTHQGWKVKKKGKQNNVLKEKFISQNQFTFRLDLSDDELKIRLYRQFFAPFTRQSLKSFSISRPNLWKLDECAGKFEKVIATERPHVLLHPHRTSINGMLLRESNISVNQMLINLGAVANDSWEIDEDLYSAIEPLIEEGGLGGIIIAIILAAAGGIERLQEIEAQVSQLTLLRETPDKFELVPTSQSGQFKFDYPFVFQDRDKTYLITPQSISWSLSLSYGFLGGLSVPIFLPFFQFEIFYHPYICEILRKLNRESLHDLLNPKPSDLLNRQRLSEFPSTKYFDTYQPTFSVTANQPLEAFDFQQTGAYSLYNWELFFHIPLLVADRLSKNQQFEDAQRWFHYIFDPTIVSSAPKPARYWKVKPFYEEALNPPASIAELLRELAAGSDELKSQIKAWREDAFNPHRLARLRLLAYMKTVVMKYLDNLIAWGDNLFSRDTIESLNEATQIYIIAAEILGEKPTFISGQDPESLNFAAIREQLDDPNYLDEFSNFLIDLETDLPAELGAETSTPEPLPPNLALYFCIPANEKLLSYWDTVADRLFKIRNCMNIAGQVRQLPLFEPPIDPALLVRAKAAGLDLRQALSAIATPNLPHYRYAYMYQKALELCNEVRSLGNALLSTLEKRDAEELALLRLRHEISLQKDILLIKKQQIEEAEETLDGLQVSQKLIEQRYNFYSTKQKIYSDEQSSLDHLEIAHGFEISAQILEVIASGIYLIPDIAAGPFGHVKTGGTFLGNAARAAASSLKVFSSQYTYEANSTLTVAGYTRRKEEWDFQANQAQLELDQIEKQILAAEIRLAIAEQDLANQEKQIDQSKEIESFLKSKFTDQELYGWMVSQLSALHYQAYQMAYDLAGKAQRTAQHELGLLQGEFSYIQFGHWDNQRKGLLAGERLHHQLRQMDVAFIEKNQRDYEITKSISLRQINPLALLQLRETGNCEFTLPEVLFDMDFPGHYKRRIKSVALTIPCVVGPYTSLNCTLRLLEHKFRNSAIANDKNDYPEKITETDERFSTVNVPIKAIAVSTGQNDSGVFELNFQGERYLPFEGAGVISTWRMELPNKFRQFDYNTITDAIVQIRYTAVEGGDNLKKIAADHVLDYIKSIEKLSQQEGLFAAFDLKQDFSSQWYKAMNPPAEATERVLMLNQLNERLPIFTKGWQPDKIQATEAYLFTSSDLLAFALIPSEGFEELSFSNGEPIGGMKSFVVKDVDISLPIVNWQLKIKDVETQVDNLWLLIRYVLE